MHLTGSIEVKTLLLAYGLMMMASTGAFAQMQVLDNKPIVQQTVRINAKNICRASGESISNLYSCKIDYRSIGIPAGGKLVSLAGSPVYIALFDDIRGKLVVA